MEICEYSFILFCLVCMHIYSLSFRMSIVALTDYINLKLHTLSFGYGFHYTVRSPDEEMAF
jgi:hypothetical protein